MKSYFRNGQEASKFAVFLTLLGLARDTSYGYGK